MTIIKIGDRLARLERRLGGSDAGLEDRLAEARAGLLDQVDRFAGAQGVEPAIGPDQIERQLDDAIAQIAEARRRA